MMYVPLRERRGPYGDRNACACVCIDNSGFYTGETRTHFFIKDQIVTLGLLDPSKPLLPHLYCKGAKGQARYVFPPYVTDDTEKVKTHLKDVSVAGEEVWWLRACKRLKFCSWQAVHNCL